MHRLQTAYTVWFNRKHGRCGHLFQGRFGASVVEEDEYILKLSRYVHLNPVFISDHLNKDLSERRKVLRNYRWSSYRSYIGLEERLDFVSYGPVLAMMGRGVKRQIRTYQRFVEAGTQDMDAAFIASKQRSRLCIGSEECLERVQEMYDRLVDGRSDSQDISFCQHSKTLEADAVIEVICDVFEIEPKVLYVRQRNSWLRPFASLALAQFGGLSQREIASVLQIGGGAAVSKQLKLLTQELAHDTQLQELWDEIKERIDVVVKA